MLIKYFALASLIIFAAADVLDLGNLDQYDSRLKNAPDVGGNTVWLSGKQGDGFDIAFSPDAKSKVQGVLDGCGQTDSSCYNEVRNVLDEADVEIDGQLDRRGFASLLSKTFKKSRTVFSLITAALLSNWKLKHQEVKGIGTFIPQTKADSASVLATATKVTVSAAGSPIITITPTPDPTTLTGSVKPSVTSVTKDGNGYSKGDLVAILDDGLARRISEVMRRMKDCDDGREFDKKHPSRKRAGPGATYGQAICGAEAAAGMATPGGPFGDLLLIDPNQLPFGFDNAAGPAAEAAHVVADFVLAYAPLITIGPELAEQLAVYLLALAIDTLIENIPLDQENRIKSTLVTTEPTTSTTSTSSSGCPHPTETPLWCGYPKEDCRVKLPETKKMEPVCKDGEHKDCPCNAPTDTFINIASNEEQKAIKDVSDLFKSINAPDPECQLDQLSGIPSNVFGSYQNNIYHHFCDQWNENNELKMTVDAAGNNKDTEVHFQRRTPPPDPSIYDNYDFDLSFTPAKGNAKCAKDCKAAFISITNACSNTGAMTLPMDKSGKYDVGCGIFAYDITKEPPPPPPPKTPLQQQTRFCYGPDAFGDHGDIQGSSQSSLTIWTCVGTGLKTIKRGDVSTFRHWATENDGVPYQYNIWWKDGCLLENGMDEIYASNPLNIKDPGYTVCQDLLIGDYTQCNNGGIGGSIQVGCLIYEFKADSNERKW